MGNKTVPEDSSQSSFNIISRIVAQHPGRAYGSFSMELQPITLSFALFLSQLFYSKHWISLSDTRLCARLELL